MKTFVKLKNDASTNPKLRHLSEEERAGLRSVLLDMLLDFDDLCKKNGLSYFLTGGTALGAVRSGGFIPWDDDIDVIMPRKDYEKLEACVQREQNDKYWVQSLKTSSVYDLNFKKYRQIGTKYVELFETDHEKAGICIDVFPLDDTCNNPVLNLIYGVVNEGLYFLASCNRMYQKKERLLSYVEDARLRRIIEIKCWIGKILHIKRNPRFWYYACERWSKCIKNPDSRYVAVSSGRGHYFGERYERKEIFPLTGICFEGHMFLGIKNYVHFLQALYGEDYMIPHHAGNREQHSLLEFELPKNTIDEKEKLCNE